LAGDDSGRKNLKMRCFFSWVLTAVGKFDVAQIDRDAQEQLLDDFDHVSTINSSNSRDSVSKGELAIPFYSLV
jgi:hypothetical protein